MEKKDKKAAPTQSRVTFRMDRELWKAGRIQAINEGIPFVELIVRGITMQLQKKAGAK